MNISPRFSETEPSLNVFILTSGPFVSSMTAAETPILSRTARKVSTVFLCSSWVPWEKLRRATFMPARSIFSIISSLLLAGPSVHTIFVLLILFYPSKTIFRFIHYISKLSHRQHTKQKFFRLSLSFFEFHSFILLCGKHLIFSAHLVYNKLTEFLSQKGA